MKNLVFILMCLFFVIPVQAGIIYVDANTPDNNDGSSWTKAYKYLQDALADANSNPDVNEICVAQGIYTPDSNSSDPNGNGDRTIAFEIKGAISIYGGFPSGGGTWEQRDPNKYATILSGDLSDNDVFVANPSDLVDEPSRSDNSYSVLIGTNLTDTVSSTIIDGFHITAGNANDLSSHSYYVGGGIFQFNGTISNCLFYSNSAVNVGGAIYNQSSSPTLIKCVFAGNYAVHGGGMHNDKSSSPLLVNCVFSGNQAFHEGGGMRSVNESTPVLINCSFSRNSARVCGGMSNNGASSIIVTNCVFWANSDDSGTGEQAQITNPDYGIIINYSCIQDDNPDDSYIPYGGIINHNKDDNPGFRDSDGTDDIAGTVDDDLRLLANSPCIEAGINNPLTELPSTCLDENPRIAGIIDMGAYEQPHGFLLSTYTPIVIPEGGSEEFTVAIAHNPQESVEVEVSRIFGDEDITVTSGQVLVFNSSNYWQPQTVQLTAEEDQDNILSMAVFGVSTDSPGFSDVNIVAVEGDNEANSIIFVDDNNSLNLTTIQQAVNAAQDGDTVFVKDGLYIGLENHEIQWDGISKHIVLTSENGPGNCIIDCQEHGRAFVLNSNQNQQDIIDGFTIRYGKACDYRSESLDSVHGGGAIFCNGTSPQIINCVLEKNLAGANASFKDGGAIDIVNSGSVRIKDCIIRDNEASHTGGGIHADDSTVLIENNYIVDNKNDGCYGGGGISLSSYSSGSIKNNIIAGNTAHYYAAGGYGAGIICINSDPSIINNTIVANTTWNGSDPGEGGGLRIRGLPTPFVSNCIIWGNESSEGLEDLDFQYPSWVLDIRYCDVGSGLVDVNTGGTPSNINADPCFVAPGYWDPNGTPTDANDDFWVDGDYHLKSYGWRWDSEQEFWDYDEVTSRCIDAGNPGSPLADEPLTIPDDPNNEWGENLRINMGAYGGTAEASMPPYDWALLGDLTNDGRIFWEDLAIQVQDWLQSENEQFGDLNRDEVVNMTDFALLARDWLKQTTWFELPEIDGDFDNDDDVDLIDFSILAAAWLTEDGEVGWNPECDISEPSDGIIDELDLAVFTENWLAGK